MIVRSAKPFSINPPLAGGEIKSHARREARIGRTTYEVHMHFEVQEVDETELLKRIGIARRIMESGS